MTSTTTDEAAAIAEIVAKACKSGEVDPRPKLGLAIIAKAEQDRSAALSQRAMEHPGDESAPAWLMHSRIAGAAGAQIQAVSDALPTPPPPLAGRVHPPHDWATWKDIAAGLAEPDEYHAHVIEAMAEAKAAGLFYNRDTGPRAASIMADRWRYPDAREDAPKDSDFATVRHFGTHCYSAGCVLRARALRAAQKKAAGELRIGSIPGRLITGQRENLTSAVIVSIAHNGSKVVIQAKRGAKAVTWEPDAVDALEAIARGTEWARKHARKAMPA